MQQNNQLGRLPVLELDEAGRRAADRHIREGEFGRLLVRQPGDQNPQVWYEQDRRRARAS